MALVLIYQDPATATTSPSHTTVGADLSGEVFHKTPAGVVTYLLRADGDGSQLTDLNGSEVTSGTVADARIASALTGKTYNGLTVTSTTGTLTITGSAVLTVSANATVSGTNTGDVIATYAEIFGANLSTPQSIPTGATYTKITAFANNGVSNNCTADAANDKITITATGVYRVASTMSFSSGTNNVTFFSAPFLGGVEQNNIHWQRKVATSAEVTSSTMTGFINVTSVPIDLDVRISHDNAGSVNITPVYLNLSIQRVS